MQQSTYNHLEKRFFSSCKTYGKWINLKNTTHNHLTHIHWINKYLSSQKYDCSLKNGLMCTDNDPLRPVIPMLRYEYWVSIYSRVLFPLYSPRQHFPWKQVIALF